MPSNGTIPRAASNKASIKSGEARVRFQRAPFKGRLRFALARLLSKRATAEKLLTVIAASIGNEHATNF